MILRRVILFLASATALATAAGVIVVALAYALYALVRPSLGPAGGAAVVAGAAALLIGLLGFVMGRAAKGPRRRRSREPDALVDRLVDFIRDKPITAIAAAVAAGLMTVRNPKYLGAAIRAFVEGRDWPKR
ncbi:MAG TPA: hypothetical protein VMU37_01550 [Caulobacteraceae bacterium]|nr:hypothetical protein [Caulobacteraceae bacterium]